MQKKAKPATHKNFHFFSLVHQLFFSVRRSLQEFIPAPARGRKGKSVRYGVGSKGSKRGSAGGLDIIVSIIVEIWK